MAFIPDQGNLVINWPQQTYDNGVKKNNDANRRYKRVIRILKRLRNQMQEDKIPEASNIPSFLIECLAWSAPITAFQHDTYSQDLRQVIIDVWNPTQKDETCAKWVEINGLKWLFRPMQPWSRSQANEFLRAAWNYIGFK
jgi:hypothetical protein